MAKLFSYTIAVDDGAAPNPFGGMCSLVICKPGIRSAAQPNDWVVGLGSKSAPSGDLAGHVVYAMRVEEVMTLKEYDKRAPQEWPHRIPDITSLDLSKRLGDCIYDYSQGDLPIQRASVHGAENMSTDLRGANALISRDFYYFGSKAIRLPDSLMPICHQTQGYKSNINEPYVAKFEAWIRGLDLEVGQLHGWPDHMVNWSDQGDCGGCTVRQLYDECDAECQ